MSKFNVGDTVEFIPEEIENHVMPEYRRYCTGLFKVTAVDDDRIQMKAVDRKSKIDGKYCTDECFRLAQVSNFNMTANDLSDLLSDKVCHGRKQRPRKTSLKE